VVDLLVGKGQKKVGNVAFCRDLSSGTNNRSKKVEKVEKLVGNVAFLPELVTRLHLIGECLSKICLNWPDLVIWNEDLSKICQKLSSGTKCGFYFTFYINW
jgi:hypothetical protein